MGPRSAFSFSLLAAALLALPGCKVPPDVASFYNANIGPLIGHQLPVDTATTAAKPAEEKKDEENPMRHREVNAEFIKEMFRVSLGREIHSQEEFDKYMNALDQGGSYEGIYNGIVYSTEYKDKERGVVPVTALKAYSEIMAQITLDQKYDPLKIRRDGESEKKDEVLPPQPSNVERAGLVAENERDGITKSAYALKRRLGEEVLKTIDLKKEYKEKLATWYARFTVFLNKRGVDFGIPQRNKPEEYYHYKWALDADEDRIKWETLNRVHVLINQGAGIRATGSAPSVVPAPQQPQATPSPGAAASPQAK